MSFLQPWLLLGLPLVALPIIIHLINQRRFQTIRWAAMMFLLAAERMTRGYSRLRQWLIMLFRMLAIATLLFAVSRPLASGWLGLAAGGRPDTTIILLDRSPSMQQRGAGSGDSKLDTGRQQLVRTLDTLGSGRWVLIESTTHEPVELESPAALVNLPSAGPASAPADLPRMLQAAYEYIRDNRPGRTDIWICSDLRAKDWNAESGRWSTLRNAFVELAQGVRFHLLAYPQQAPGNIAVRVTDARRRQSDDAAELLVSLSLTREGGNDAKVSIPVQFEIEGARSVLTVEMAGPHAEFKDHAIPLERTHERGWGRVSIPSDANPADDEFYFVFDQPPPRRSIVVVDDPKAGRPLELAAGTSFDPAVPCSTEMLSPDQVNLVEWEQIALVLWQAPLPTAGPAALLRSFVERGGVVVFFPPQNPDATELFGMHWQSWEGREDRFAINSWRSDEDLLARTLSGAALPVGQLEVPRRCKLEGESTALATFEGGSPLLARVPTERGGAYFWTTTPAPRDSSLASSGVVLYAFVQRALAAGAAALGKARQLDAGNAEGENPLTWNRLAESRGGLSTEAAYQSGAYGSEDRLLAVNRPAVEDEGKIVDERRLGELFRGLDYTRVDDQAGNLASLIQEIWRIFLASMVVAMVAESALCLTLMSRKPRPAVS